MWSSPLRCCPFVVCEWCPFFKGHSVFTHTTNARISLHIEGPGSGECQRGARLCLLPLQSSRRGVQQMVYIALTCGHSANITCWPSQALAETRTLAGCWHSVGGETSFTFSSTCTCTRTYTFICTLTLHLH